MEKITGTKSVTSGKPQRRFISFSSDVSAAGICLAVAGNCLDARNLLNRAGTCSDVGIFFESSQNSSLSATGILPVKLLESFGPQTYSPTSRKCRWPPQFETFIALVSLPVRSNVDAMGLKLSMCTRAPAREA
ncbi:hypothetical protein Tco_0982750 [Tanacetum coccineum]